MSDTFRNMDSGPATQIEIVTPSDTVDLARPSRGIRVVTGGVMKVTLSDGTTPTLAFSNGETRPICVTRIWATGITCATIESMS